MLNDLLKQLKVAFILLIVLTLLTGLVYPLVVTGLAQLLFPSQANGCLIEKEGKIIGSAHLGQAFSDTQYFWSRPSATMPYPYNTEASSGSNLGPTNPDFLNSVKNRVADLKKVDPAHQTLVPVDLVTASASGLDPEISPQAAYYQVARVAKARSLSPDELNTLITSLIRPRTLGVLGEPRVNVLALNLALDQLSEQRAHHG